MANDLFSEDSGTVSGGMIYRHSGFSNTLTDSFSSPQADSWGLTWDGLNLISLNRGNDDVYVHSGFSSTITDSFHIALALPVSMGYSTDGDLMSADGYNSEVKKREASGRDAEAELLRHYEKIVRLDIPRMEDLAVDIGAHLAVPPRYGELITDQYGPVGQRLLEKARSMGVPDFIKFMKSVEDETYHGSINAFRVIGCDS